MRDTIVGGWAIFFQFANQTASFTFKMVTSKVAGKMLAELLVIMAAVAIQMVSASTSTLYGWDVIKWSMYKEMSADKVYEGVTSPLVCLGLCIKVRVNKTHI